MLVLLMFLKQPKRMYMCAYLWLAVLAVVNADEMLQPKPDETGTFSKESVRHVLKRRETAETIIIPALGRPLHPGMLYDCRKDSFIPGITLWPDKLLKKQLNSHPQSKTNVEFSIADSLESKFSLLDVSASLKASFMGGLVEVGGSAKYLSDTKSSNQQSRITMHYSETTRFDQLTMSHLSAITYPEVFEQKSATHVVMAVLYGAQVFMVFDQKFSEEENKQTIEGELNAMVRKIPQSAVEGKTALQMTDTDRRVTRNIECKIHGDIRLQENPSTYMEALSIYKKLPSLLKENPENAVPVKVWLYPLHLLNATAARLEREISTNVAFRLQEIIDDLGEAERTYKDLSKKTMADIFKDIKERLSSFHNSFRTYKTLLMKAVGRVLPAVRGGEMEEKSLDDILEIHRKSPFNADLLKQWLHDAKTEINFLSSQVKSLEGIRVEDSECRDTRGGTYYAAVTCLTFTSLKYEDPYLSALNEFLKTDRFKEQVREQTVFSLASATKWFNNMDTIERVKFNTDLFKTLAKGLQGQPVLLIISAVSDPSIPGSSIYGYANGILTDKKIQHPFRVLARLDEP